MSLAAAPPVSAKQSPDFDGLVPVETLERAVPRARFEALAEPRGKAARPRPCVWAGGASVVGFPSPPLLGGGPSTRPPRAWPAGPPAAPALPTRGGPPLRRAGRPRA